MPGPETQVYTSTVVLLNSRPSMLAPAVGGDNPQQALFFDDHLAAELTGRLDRLLTLAEHPDVDLVIDPALYDAVVAMTSAYLVAGDGQTTPIPGTGSEDAAAFLTRLTPLLHRPSTYRMPYNYPDVAAAAAVDCHQAVAGILPPEHPLAHLSLAVVAAGGDFAAETAAFLTLFGPDLVLADTAALPVQSVTGLPRVVAVTADSPADSPAQIRGRMLSAQLLGSLADAPVVRLVRDDAELELDAIDLPGRLRTSTRSLDDPAVGSTLALTTVTRSAQPAPELRDTSHEIAAFFDFLGDLTNDQAGAAESSARGISALWSTMWSDTAEAIAWARIFLAGFEVDLLGHAVTLRIAPEVYLSGADNLVPVQVTNGYEVPVSVRVRLVSENPSRIAIKDSALIDVRPGETVTIRMEPSVLGSGPVLITAWVETASGTKLGDYVNFQVITSNQSRLGLLVLMAFGLVFMAGTFLKVSQVRRIRRSHPQDALGGPANRNTGRVPGLSELIGPNRAEVQPDLRTVRTPKPFPTPIW
jgi:hypothetical protein